MFRKVRFALVPDVGNDFLGTQDVATKYDQRSGQVRWLINSHTLVINMLEAIATIPIVVEDL